MGYIMRVVLTGISGLDKEEVLAKICTLCNCKDPQKSGADPDVGLDNTAFENAYIYHTFDLEHEIFKHEKFRFPIYLDIPEMNLLDAKNRTLDMIIDESKEREISYWQCMLYITEGVVYLVYQIGLSLLNSSLISYNVD